MNDKIAIATIQKDIEYIRASILKMETLLSVYATKQELSASIKEVESLIYKENSLIKNELKPVIDDMKNRKSDRNRLFWMVVASLVTGVGNIVFNYLTIKL